MTVASGINAADIVTAAGFLAVVVGAMAIHAVKLTAKESPRARMLKRAQDAAAAERVTSDDTNKGSSARRRAPWQDSQTLAVLKALKADVLHITGLTGLYWMAGIGVTLALAAGVAGKLAGLSPWLNLLWTPITALLGAWLTFATLRSLYRRRFLAQFPDALDLIIRAIRAGVPVTQAIRTAGKELPHPAGREFLLMGDALRLGLDQDDVMAAASQRIDLPDFRFFAVCLQLQRETGGPLAETLENLSGIIRARREVQLKTRALTAQGRTSSKIIAAVPLVTLGGLQLMADHYLDVLFYTPSGHTVLWLAAGMVVSGLLVINRMARLED